jgi:hypothetical protein
MDDLAEFSIQADTGDSREFLRFNLEKSELLELIESLQFAANKLKEREIPGD